MKLVEETTMLYIKQIRNNEPQGLESLIEQYKPLLHKMAFLVCDLVPMCGLDVDDFFAAGIIGLYEAAMAYDESKGAFPAFAKLLVRRSVWRHVKENTSRNKNVLNHALSFEQELDYADNLTLEDIMGQNDEYISLDVLPDDRHEQFYDYFFVEFDDLEKDIIILRLDGFAPSEIISALAISKYRYYEVMKTIKEKIIEEIEHQS